MNKAIFLDRDGTLNPDPGYISNPDDFELFPGVPEALVKLQTAGYKLVIITNQSGIARGLITPEQLDAVHQKMLSLFVPYNIKIEGIYHCPHHPDFPSEDGISVCNCRKPAPGMIYKAIEDLNIEPNESFMIGDKLSDVELGINSGVSSIKIGTAREEKHPEIPFFATLADAVNWILKK